jgi:hypothetical protein
MHLYGAHCFSQHLCNMNNGRNPCLNGGTCYVNYESHRLRQDYVCNCPSNYFGEFCQISSSTINITFNHNQSDNILATVIQLFDIHSHTHLRLKKQWLHKQHLPLLSTIRYEERILPSIALVKRYHSNDQSMIDYHLLYILSISKQYISITLQFNQQTYCPHTSTISQLNQPNFSKKI